jgi:murein DD-endopeptidase MepM/ murein hydrolase activator NlpD
MIVSDDDSPVRQLRLSREAVRLCIALALIAISGLSSLATAVLMGTSPNPKATRLEAENELLEEELATLNSRIDTLELSLDQLARKDEMYRLLAGLDPLGADVLQAGIGGPDADSLEARSLYRVDAGNGRRAFSASTHLSSLLRRARVLAFSWREAEDTLSERVARFESTPSISPTRGYVSSTFSSARWHPILDRPRPHTGIDIVAQFGTPVVASAKGRVSAVGHQSEYGLMIQIDHGYGVVTRYAHLSKTVVRVGQMVDRGKHIGNVGKSGLAAGPHLHYEVLLNGTPANPRHFILDTQVVPD